MGFDVHDRIYLMGCIMMSWDVGGLNLINDK